MSWICSWSVPLFSFYQTNYLISLKYLFHHRIFVGITWEKSSIQWLEMLNSQYIAAICNITIIINICKYTEMAENQKWQKVLITRKPESSTLLFWIQALRPFGFGCWIVSLRQLTSTCSLLPHLFILIPTPKTLKSDPQAYRFYFMGKAGLSPSHLLLTSPCGSL